MSINILIYIWLVFYLLAIPFIFYQSRKGKNLSWRDVGFLLAGFGFSFIPVYWYIHI